jgi:hypothetical protein
MMVAFAAAIALAPSVASVLDARTEALALSDPFSAHVDETGSRHDHRTHVDDCPLCRLATNTNAERQAAELPQILAAFSPTPDAQLPRPVATAWRWSAPSRGPPLA